MPAENKTRVTILCQLFYPELVSTGQLLTQLAEKLSWLRDFTGERELRNCSFQTYVPRDRLPDSLAAASAGIVSLGREFTGLSVPSKMFGVMAAARPVLALRDRRSETGRIVEKHDCGIVVEPGDIQGLTEAILALAEHPDKCREMGERGNQARRAHDTAKDAAEQYRELVRSVG